jgi:DNA-binding response OmpR family regulator
MAKILVVDDVQDVFHLVKSILEPGHQVYWADTLHAAEDTLQSKKMDLVLLDVQLPDGNGFHFMADLQKKLKDSIPPVIFLTAKDHVSEKVLGFSLGAEDYIPKSSDYLEMKARLEARVKRLATNQEPKRFENVGPFQVDLHTQEVQWLHDGKMSPIELTRLEFKIFWLLAHRLGDTVSREEILDKVWGPGFQVYTRSVDTHVSNLRKKLPKEAVKIESASGQGYRLTLLEKLH